MPSTPDPSSLEDEQIWTKILSEIQSRSSLSLPQGSVLVLGNNESGKTSLISQLQRNYDPKKGAGLEYHYLEVYPDYKDGSYAYQLGSTLPDVGPGESTRLGVWVLDGDVSYARMVRFALGQSAECLDRSVVLLCVSMSEPWTMIDSLEKWASVLNDQLAFYDQRSLIHVRNKQTNFWQEYLEPLDSSSHSDTGVKVPSMEVDQTILPLGQSILTNNLGLPVIVVVTKCDIMSTLDKDYDFKEEHFDFIQQRIRKFCLNYGASLIYTSAKDGQNCGILYKYILHRIYGFPFTKPAHVVEKDAIFIPSGWDNESKIGILIENLMTMKAIDVYSKHIKKPALRRSAIKDLEVHAEDEQTFLARMQATFVVGQGTCPQPSSTPTTRRSAVESPVPPRAISPSTDMKTSPSSVQSQQKKNSENRIPPGSTGTTADGNSSLAAFFNNLLRTKAGDATNGVLSPPTKVENTPDASAELQRMLAQSQQQQHDTP